MQQEDDLRLTENYNKVIANWNTGSKTFDVISIEDGEEKSNGKITFERSALNTPPKEGKVEIGIVPKADNFIYTLLLVSGELATDKYFFLSMASRDNDRNIINTIPVFLKDTSIFRSAMSSARDSILSMPSMFSSSKSKVNPTNISNAPDDTLEYPVDKAAPHISEIKAKETPQKTSMLSSFGSRASSFFGSNKKGGKTRRRRRTHKRKRSKKSRKTKSRK